MRGTGWYLAKRGNGNNFLHFSHARKLLIIQSVGPFSYKALDFNFFLNIFSE